MSLLRIKVPVEGRDYFLTEDGFPVVRPHQIVQATHDPIVPADRKKVICLGCSFTAGYDESVDEQETYPAHLQRILGPEYVVVNMGRRNYGLALCIDWYHRYVKTQPSICVIQVPDMGRQPYPGLQPFEAAYYTSTYGARQAVFAADPWDSYDIALAMEELMRRDLARLDGFRQALQSAGIQVIVVAYQGTWGLLEPFGRRYYKQVYKLMRRARVPVIDLSWRRLKRNGQYLDPKLPTHPNGPGNKVIASLVGKAINAHSLNGN